MLDSRSLAAALALVGCAPGEPHDVARRAEAPAGAPAPAPAPAPTPAPRSIEAPPTETAVKLLDAFAVEREAWLVPGDIIDVVPDASLRDAWPIPWSGAAARRWELDEVEYGTVLRIDGEVVGAELSAGPDSPQLDAIVRRHRGQLRTILVTSGTTALAPKVADAIVQLAADEVVLLVAGPEEVDLTLLADLGPKLRGLFLVRGEFRGAPARADLGLLARFPRLAALAVTGPSARDIETIAGLPGLRRLELVLEHRDRPLADTDLEQIARLERLEVLKLHGTRVSDAGLAHLGKLARLRELYPGRIGEAGLAHLGELPALRTLALHVNPIGAAGLAHLGRMTSLRSLDLAHTQVGDDALAHLARLAALRELNLSNTAVGDAGMAHLAGLAELRALDLSATRVGDAGVATLATLGRLTTLALVDAPITDAGLEHVASLGRLQSLDLGGTAVGDPGLARLARLRELRVLGLNATRISDRGLAHLAALELTALHLGDTAVGDAGLRRVARSTSLRLLELGNTRVRRPTAYQLARERPDLEIQFE